MQVVIYNEGGMNMETTQGLKQEEMTVSLQPEELLNLPYDYEERMTPEAKRQVQSLAAKIDIKSRDFVINYGAEQQATLGKFADTMLSGRDSEEMGEVGELLNVAMDQIKKYNSGLDGEKKRVFGRAFSKSKNKVEQIRDNYKTVDKKIEVIVQELSRKRMLLSKVYDDFSSLFDSNRETYEYLATIIYAGEIAQKEAEEKLEEMQCNPNMDPQDIRDFSDDINSFSERLHDLKLTRAISISLAPQIRSVQRNAERLERSITTAINTSIPLWKTQMALALGIRTVRSALDAKNNVDDVTNQMFLAVFQAGKDLSIETAQASQRGVVDIETVRKVNQNLVEALSESTRITREGIEKRKQESMELEQLETSLVEAIKNIR